METPRLMALNGCDAPVPGGLTLATVGEHVFDECPVRFADAWAESTLASFLRRRPDADLEDLPAKQVQAWEYLASLQRRPAAEEEPEG
jgi:hypothetical protein